MILHKRIMTPRRSKNQRFAREKKRLLRIMKMEVIGRWQVPIQATQTSAGEGEMFVEIIGGKR